MPIITNNLEQFHDEIVRRLTRDFDAEWQLLWTYCEMTQLLTYAFSVTFLINENLGKRQLFYRIWENDYYDRISGIYNLELIKIKEEELLISLNDITEFQEFIKRDIGTVKYEGIVLDGYRKEFIDFKTNKTLIWNLDEEMNEPLRILVEKVRSFIPSKTH